MLNITCIYATGNTHYPCIGKAYNGRFVVFGRQIWLNYIINIYTKIRTNFETKGTYWQDS